MAITLILSAVLMAVIQDRPERFPGAQLLGWLLLVLCLSAFVGAFLFGTWDGIQKGYAYWQFSVKCGKSREICSV